MVPRSHYMPRLNRHSSSYPPAGPIVMDTLENAHARLGDALYGSPSGLRREVVRVLAEMRVILQADGRLPPQPPRDPLDELRVRPRQKRLPPVHLRTLTEQEMDYYRLLRRKRFTMAAQNGTPAAAVGEDKLQKVAADLDRERSLDGKSDSGCMGAVNDARKDMATD
jgi:hypothetical protein